MPISQHKMYCFVRMDTLDSLEYEYIGCKIDSLYSMHFYGEPEG